MTDPFEKVSTLAAPLVVTTGDDFMISACCEWRGTLAESQVLVTPQNDLDRTSGPETSLSDQPFESVSLISPLVRLAG